MGYFALFVFLLLLLCSFCANANVSAGPDSVAENAAIFSILKPVKAVRMLGQGFQNAMETVDRIDVMLNNTLIQALYVSSGHLSYFTGLEWFPWQKSTFFDVFGNLALTQKCEMYHMMKPFGVIHAENNDTEYVMCSAKSFQDGKNDLLQGRWYGLFKQFGRAPSPEVLLTWHSMFVLSSIKGNIVGYMCLRDQYEGQQEMEMVLETYRWKSRGQLEEFMRTLKKQFTLYSFKSSYKEAISYASKHAMTNPNNVTLVWAEDSVIWCNLINVRRRGVDFRYGDVNIVL